MFADGVTIIMFLINHHFVGTARRPTTTRCGRVEVANVARIPKFALGLARYRPMTYVLIMYVGAT